MAFKFLTLVVLMNLAVYSHQDMSMLINMGKGMKSCPQMKSMSNLDIKKVS